MVSNEASTASNVQRNVTVPTPKAKRTTWSQAEERQFLVMCAENAIAEQLDNCVTSAGNEEVYTAIQAGLVEAGFAKRNTEKIRLKYRKLKTRFNDVRENNLRKTGRSRKEWVFYDLANSVWGHRPVATKVTMDTDELSSNGDINEDNSGNENTEESVSAKRQVDPKSLVGLKSKRQRVDLTGDTYFVDKLVELEEKRISEQMKLERERMECERKTREDQLGFQREMLAFVMQMQSPRGTQQQHPQFNQFRPANLAIPHSYFPAGEFSFGNKNTSSFQ